MFDKLYGKTLMDSKALARHCRALRAEKGLTQKQLAEMIVGERSGKKLQKQVISRAENEEVGTKADSVRLAIIETLTGRPMAGPFYVYRDQLEGNSNI